MAEAELIRTVFAPCAMASQSGQQGSANRSDIDALFRQLVAMTLGPLIPSNVIDAGKIRHS
jgi:hypothetical protein